MRKQEASVQITAPTDKKKTSLLATTEQRRTNIRWRRQATEGDGRLLSHEKTPYHISGIMNALPRHSILDAFSNSFNNLRSAMGMHSPSTSSKRAEECDSLHGSSKQSNYCKGLQDVHRPHGKLAKKAISLTKTEATKITTHCAKVQFNLYREKLNRLSVFSPKTRANPASYGPSAQR